MHSAPPHAEIVSADEAVTILHPMLHNLSAADREAFIEQLPVYERNDCYVEVTADPWRVTQHYRLRVALGLEKVVND